MDTWIKCIISNDLSKVDAVSWELIQLSLKTDHSVCDAMLRLKMPILLKMKIIAYGFHNNDKYEQLNYNHAEHISMSLIINFPSAAV